MKKALSWLIELFSPEDYSAYDEVEMKKYCGLSLEEVSMALRDTAETIYQYTVSNENEMGFNYRGKELFPQRGCLIHKEMDCGTSDFITTTYNTELWLLENMTFAIVRCVHMVIEAEGNCYETEYRSYVKTVEGREDLLFSPDDLISEMEEMCVPQWEQTATIYEL